MIRWIEIREKLPPSHMQVLFYIRDEVDGFTEDYCVQGCVTEVVDDGTYERKVTYCLKVGELSAYENVSYWTLLPEPPQPWR